jgi:hypothetical protein
MNLGPRLDTLYTPTLMTLDKALDLAIKLNSDTLEDWRYVVDADVKSGLAKIEVIDEDGEFISHM